jgi:nucleotide-binding universal stress UspA family protein
MAVPLLAGIDPLTRDAAPARFAAYVAAIAGAPLTLVSVHAGEGDLDPLAAAQMGEELAPDASDALERARAAVAGDPVQADVLAIAAGSAPRGLELAVEQFGAGLLVLGAAQSGGPLGSTGERLLSGTRCPVARLNAGWERPAAPATVGAAFVDTAEGHAALHGAHDLARLTGARLRVLVVLRHEAARLRAEQAAAAAASGLLGAPVDIDVLVGDPAGVLVDACGELDLLVCGARGYGPAESVLLGGVGRRVAGEGNCPVIVLARGPTSRGAGPLSFIARDRTADL